jgi:hypothetical protein
VELVTFGQWEVAASAVVNHQHLARLTVPAAQAQWVALVGFVVRHLVLPEALLHSVDKEREHIAVLSRTEVTRPIKNQDDCDSFQQHDLPFYSVGH